MHMRLHDIDVGDIPVARRKQSAPAKQRESVADEGTVGGGGVFPFGGVIGAAGAAFAGASIARCSRSVVTPRYGGIACGGKRSAA
ncbi:hypothetical protein CLM76_17880 [Vreelandella venusta]|nr:hypothetical protein CLM76_17880 [Halomonas hydrothermalis]